MDICVRMIVAAVTRIGIAVRLIVMMKGRNTGRRLRIIGGWWRIIRIMIIRGRMSCILRDVGGNRVPKSATLK